MEKSDLDGDGKFTFEEFLSAMKDNEEANKLIMQIADAQQTQGLSAKFKI